MTFSPKVWGDALRRLQNEIPDFAFDAWIAPLAAKICADRLVLGCPTSFHRDRVRLHHLAAIERCWQDACRDAGSETRVPLELLTRTEFADIEGQPVDPSILLRAKALHQESLLTSARPEMRKVEAAQRSKVVNGSDAGQALRAGAPADPNRSTQIGSAPAPVGLRGPSNPAVSPGGHGYGATGANGPGQVSNRVASHAGTTDAVASGPAHPMARADSNGFDDLENAGSDPGAAEGSAGPSLRIVPALDPVARLDSAFDAIPAAPLAGPLRKAPARDRADGRALTDLSGSTANAGARASNGLEFGLDGQPGGKPQPFSFDSFVMGPCNALAREAALALARRRQRSLNQLYLAGGSGMGKTHLARATAEEARLGLAAQAAAYTTANSRTSAQRYERSDRQPRGPRSERQPAHAARILFTSAEQFTSEFVSAMRNGRNEAWTKRYRGPIELLVVEDIHYLVGRTKTQQELYHTIEHVLDSGGRVLLTGDRAPRDLTGLDERMRALVARGFVAELDRPDAMVRRHVLRAKAAAGGVHLPADCLDLLVDSTDSEQASMRDVEGVLIQVVTTASLLGRPIDLALTRDAINLKSGTSSVLAPRKLDVSEVVRLVAAFFGTRPEALASRSRRRDVLVPRQLSMYLANRYTEASLTEIGRGLGRDHPSVRNAIQRIERQVLENAPVRYQVEALTERIERYVEERQR